MPLMAQISDLHFGRHSNVVMESLLTSLAEARPDLVIISGDLTQRARSSQFIEARQFLDRIGGPKLVVPGNHDLPLYNLAQRMLRPLDNYRRFIAPVDQPGGFYSDGGLAVLGLDTTRRLSRKNGRASIAQIEMMKERFASAAPGAFKSVVAHHPFATASHEAVELAGRSNLAMQAFAASGVQLLMSGHHHIAGSGAWIDASAQGSVLVVHAGTAFSTRVRGGGGNTYNLVRVAPDRVAVSILEWRGGSGFQILKESEYAFDGAVWRALDGPLPRP